MTSNYGWRTLGATVTGSYHVHCGRPSDDADEDMLNQFIAGSTDINGKPIELFHADSAADITKFFKNVTQSVQTTSTSPAKPASKHSTSGRPGSVRPQPSSNYYGDGMD